MRIHLILSTLIFASVGTLSRPHPATGEVDATSRDLQAVAGDVPAAITERDITGDKAITVSLSARGVGPLGSGASAGSGAPASSIRALQYLLGANGHKVAVDGKFGPETSGAVKSFQRGAGLAVDGNPGPNTLGALVDVIRRGSKGQTVSAAQSTLNGAGAGISIDGSFGPATEKEEPQARGGRPGKATPQPKPKPKPKPNPGTYNNGRCPAGKGARNNDVVPNPNGCGPADGVPVPELNFNACCNAHDRCYSDCSKSKMKCDVTFLNCMYKRCDALYEDWWEVPARATCKGTAAVYYSAVERLGDGPFESATKKHCICS